MEHRREAAVRIPNLEPKEGRCVGRLTTTASVIGVPGDEPKGGGGRGGAKARLADTLGHASGRWR